jgi:hypothetical protein
MEDHRVETSRLPHFLDHRLTDGGEVVSLTRQLFFTPRKISWYSFLLAVEATQGRSAAGRIRSIEKANYIIGNRTRDLQVCGIVLQPTTLRIK